MSITLLWGDEPYGIEKRKQKIVGTIQMPEMNLQVFEGSFDKVVRNACYVFPFMEPKRVIILNISSLDDISTDDFESYLKKPSVTTELIIIADSVDQRKKMYKTLKDKDILYPCNKVSDEELKKVLSYEIKKRGANIQGIAYAEFVKRLNYHENDDMNLIGMVSFIDSMVSVSKDITLDLVERYVPKYEEANIFGLTQLIKSKDCENLYKEAGLIDSSCDEQIKILSLLLRDYRLAYKLKFFDRRELSDKPASIKTSFGDYSMSELISCMEILTGTVTDVKTGRIASELALKSALIKLVNIEKRKGAAIA